MQETLDNLRSVFQLHPSALIDPPKKLKQQKALDKAGDMVYEFYGPIEKAIREIENDLVLACNDVIMATLLDDCAELQVRVQLLRTEYERVAKTNQHLQGFYQSEILSHIRPFNKAWGQQVWELTGALQERFNFEVYKHQGEFGIAFREALDRSMDKHYYSTEELEELVTKKVKKK